MGEGTDNKGPLVKGVGFLGIFKFIKLQPEGDALLASVLEKLSPESAKVCGHRIITVLDYPYRAFVELLRATDKILGVGDLSVCMDIGVYTADLDYQFFFEDKKVKFQPRDLFRDCGIYWKSYYTNAGYMKTVDNSPDNSVIRIHDFPQMDPAHCRLMEGWMAQSMIKAGVSWYHYQESCCMSKGGEYHEFSGAWRLREEGEKIQIINRASLEKLHLSV